MVIGAEVWLWDKLAGAVLWDEAEQLASFEFDQGFLRSGWDIAPITMPLRQGKRVYAFPEIRRGRNDAFDTFKGLPGLLADMLPDKYGNRLINAWLATKRPPDGQSQSGGITLFHREKRSGGFGNQAFPSTGIYQGKFLGN
jgi:serine/threonine-protein kinase HipA